MGSDPAGIHLPTSSAFQSTLPGWGATTADFYRPEVPAISIHAPRMGSDSESFDKRAVFADISIHAPRMGSDRERRTARTGSTHFNPRSPDGERRSSACSSESSSPYFNPRSPDGERRVTLSRVIGVSNFNPRSPDGERQSEGEKLAASLRFQSTLPGWGATQQ